MEKSLQIYKKPIKSIIKNSILTFDFIGFLQLFDKALIFITVIIIDLSEEVNNYILLNDIEIKVDKRLLYMKIIVGEYDIYSNEIHNININFNTNKLTNEIFYSIIESINCNNKLILHFAKKSIGGIKLSFIEFDEILDGNKIIPDGNSSIVRADEINLGDFWENDVNWMGI